MNDMNMKSPNAATDVFVEAHPFSVQAHVTSRTPFIAADTQQAEQVLLNALAALPPAGLLPIAFTGVRISSEAARQLLRRALLRLAGGELIDRYLVLEDLGDSLYNVEVMLESESLVAVERSNDQGPQLRGSIDPAVRDTYAYLLSVPTATASMVQHHFSLTNISTATNRLTSLAKLAVARRVEQRPVSSGGREYVYAAVR
jgi:hypothetical protein